MASSPSIRDWNFTYLNAEAERHAGASRGRLLGQNIWDNFPA